MKKKPLLAMLLALTVFAGGASMTGCNLIGNDPPDTDQTETVSVTGVSLNANSLQLTVGESRQLVATVTPATATNKKCLWETSDPDVVTVSASGKLTAIGAGIASVTVTTDDGGKTDVCTVTVSPVGGEDEVIKVTGVALSETALTLDIGESRSLTATVTPADATDKTVTWSSSDSDTVSVDGTGKITALRAGNATITATTADGGHTATCTVTVKEKQSEIIKVTGVTVSPAALTLTVGESGSVTATVTPENATDKTVSWSSSDSTTASVDGTGRITAIKKGTVTVTATTADGGHTATCTVTVNDPPVEEYTVTFVSEGNTVHTATVKKGETVQYYSMTREGYFLKGWKTSESSGQLYDFDTPVNGELTLYAAWEKVSENISYTYAGYECAAFEWEDGDPAKAKVEYKLHGGSGYTEVDGNLVRAASASGKARVDAVGLKGNQNYDFKITSSNGAIYTVENMFIGAYDRSGYAHFGKSDGVGAYKDDGTPKDGAVIYYVTESNKNDVDGKGNSVVELLMNQKGNKPMIIRIIGTVGAATWKKGAITYTKTSDNTTEDGKYLLPSAIVDKNGNPFEHREYSQSELKGKHNDLDTSVYSELDGLSSKMSWNEDKQEFDSCWNDASISGAQNVTVEGIGEDARIFQWGFTFKNSKSIEVRNITFEDYTEDACSFEGGSSDVSDTSPSGFNYGRFWVHHNVFEEGVNYWDVCKEQDKGDGDGSTDVKRVAFVTFAYNVYHETHKTGLVGSDNKTLTASVTFHHNLYDGCKARLPLARQANMHMYNNYYKGSTSTDISLRANAYALVENCYFEKAKSGSTSTNFDFPADTTNGYGYAKVVGCVFADASGKAVSASTSYGKGVPDSNLLMNVSRTTAMNSNNKYGSNFDMDGSVFYYANGKSNVESMLTAEQVKEQLPSLAGVQKRGVSVSAPSGGGTTDPDTPPETEGETITVIEDFSALKGNETYNITLSGNAKGYLVGDRIVASKSGSTLDLGTDNGLKLQSATKLKFSTAALSKTVKLIIKLDGSKADFLNLTVNGGTAQRLQTDSNGNIVIILQADTEYEIGRAEAEALIAAISLVVG